MSYEQSLPGEFALTGEEGKRTRARGPERLGDFVYPRFAYKPHERSGGSAPERVPVVVAGAGMVGLTFAMDLALKGVACVLLDDNDTVSAGSRSIAQARRTMQIWSRLGAASPMFAHGVHWSKGHTHYSDRCVLSFEVFPERESRFPPFVSLAQYYVEDFLVKRAMEIPNLDIRWRHRVAKVEARSDIVGLIVETPDGPYTLEADWIVGADGARSTVRQASGIDFPGDRLRDKFVIADVKLFGDLPHERNFWFSPPFYDGNTVLRVPQSDGIWRIDWQIDPDGDAQDELDPDVVQARLRRMLGDIEFKVEWVSTYTSEHRLADTFRKGRVMLVGDAAHQLSPFGGGRGGNSGVQDADNLAWKLAAVVKGQAREKLLDSYSAERRPIAVRNIEDSKLSTEFITPKSPHSAALHSAVLALSGVAPFANAYVNTGRFSVWPVLETSPLSRPDGDPFHAQGRPGTPAFDSRLSAPGGGEAWLGDRLGDDFVLVLYGAQADAPFEEAALKKASEALFPIGFQRIVPGARAEGAELADIHGSFASQYDARPGTAYLFRPDQHVLARWRSVTIEKIETAVRATLAGGETC